ncbi:MAG: ATP-binding protein [Chloroflexota bacterium]
MVGIESIQVPDQNPKQNTNPEPPRCLTFLWHKLLQKTPGNSLAIRYLSIATIFLVVIELLFGAFQVYTNYQQNLAHLENKIATHTSFLASVSTENILSNNFLLLEELMAQTNKDLDVVYAVVVHADGHTLTRFIDHANPLIAATQVRFPEASTTLLDLIHQVREDSVVYEQRVPIMLNGNPKPLGEVWLGYSTVGLRGQLRASFLNTLLATLVINVILIGLTILLFNTMIHTPLLRLGEFAENMAGGDLPERIPVARLDEIGRLQNAFNHMADKLANTMHGLQEAKAEVERANQALRISEAEARKLSYVASLTNNAVMITDANAKIEWVNQGFIDMNGYTLEEAIGKRPGELLHGPDTDPDTIRSIYQHIDQAKAYKTDILSYTKSGRAYWAKTDFQPVRDEHGVVTHFIVLRIDITARKEYEQQLQRAKEAAEAADQTKSTFLTNMSHEIRTPLNGIIGVSDMMLDLNLPTDQLDYVSLIHQSGNSLLATINDILDFSTLDADTLALTHAPFAIQQCIDETLDFYRDDIKLKSLHLEVDIADTIPAKLVGDAMRIQQVLNKLLGNALKFTEKGSISISVQGQYLPPPPPYCPAQYSGAQNSSTHHPAKPRYRLDIAVKDTGIGIKPDDLERIFVPFTQADGSHTRKRGGTGLGLTISQRITRLMGGDLTVQSKWKQGSIFSFYVILEGQQPTPEESKPRRRLKQIRHRYDPQMAERMPLTILIAEDNRVNQMVLTKMLRKMGYQADLANDGVQAVQAFQQKAEAGTPYDVILMDIQMPNMDGVAATQKIRDYNDGIKHDGIKHNVIKHNVIKHNVIKYDDMKQPYIVAVTAHAMEGDRERYLAAGMDNYVSKPVLGPRLISALKEAAQAIHPQHEVQSEGQMVDPELTV